MVNHPLGDKNRKSVKVKRMIKQATPDNISQAVKILQTSGLVAFPTDTVYGVGADAFNDEAVRKIYDLKNRGLDKPLGILVHSIDQAKEIAQFDDRAQTLAQIMWPGALSLVLPVNEAAGMSATALAGQKTVSVRMPNHPVILELLKKFGKPIAAPSANPSGQLSAVTALDVARDLGDGVPVILADGTKLIGIESTIIDLTKPQAVVLRQGAMSIEAIEELIGRVTVQDSTHSALVLKTPIRLKAIDVKDGEAFLGFGNPAYIGVEKIGFVKDMPGHLWRNLSPEGDLHAAARHLYQMLQELDNAGATCIAVMNIPEQGLGVAINDRLARIKGKE